MRRSALRFTVIVGLWLLAGPLYAQEPDRIEADDATRQTTPASLPVYRPPRRGAPAVRVGGATRGPHDPLPVLQVLAPDHVGLTLTAQPVLQWHLSRATLLPLEFALIDDNRDAPLLELDLGTEHPAGIGQVELSTHGITLPVGRPLRWSVALVPDRDARSGDVVASGMVERVESHADLRARLAQAGDREQVAVLAAAGIWYDALALLARLITATPGDTDLQAQRAALLAQAGITLAEQRTTPATAERQAAETP